MDLGASNVLLWTAGSARSQDTPLLSLFPAAAEMAYHRKIAISHAFSHNQVIKETAMKGIQFQKALYQPNNC